MKKKINIILVGQFFPPYQTPRATRMAELAKGFAQKGHNVIVYALLGHHDYSVFTKDTGIKINNLGISRFGNIDSSGGRNTNLFYRALARLFFTKLEFPRIEFLFMMNRDLEFDILNSDLVISVAQPYPIHWGIAKMKMRNLKFPLWVSDCGDPYMGDPFEKRPFYFKYVEKWWCNLTDYITVPIDNAKNAYYMEYRNKIRVIPQGFDFSNIDLPIYKINKIPTFVYAGVVYIGQRDPSNFLDFLKGLNIDFKFIVYTKNLKYFSQYKKDLGDKLEIYDYIPREELLKVLSKADFLINLKNKGSVQAPSKLIDYELSKRPILEITTEFQEKTAFEDFLKKDYSKKISIPNISAFDIKNVTNDFLNLYYDRK